MANISNGTPAGKPTLKVAFPTTYEALLVRAKANGVTTTGPFQKAVRAALAPFDWPNTSPEQYPDVERTLAALWPIKAEIIQVQEFQDRHLIATGWQPHVCRGKFPPAIGWNTGEVTPERIKADRKTFPDATNTGARMGRVVGADIDVEDVAHAALFAGQIKKTLGHSPLHVIGQKPGGKYFFRNETPCKKITITHEVPDGVDEQTGKPKTKRAVVVEFLGAGQQAVILGTHPDTGTEYTYTQVNEDGDFELMTPLNTPVNSLPAVTTELIRACAFLIAGMATGLGYVGVKVTGDTGEECKATNDSSGAPAYEKTIREAAGWCDPNAARDAWRDDVAAISTANIVGDDNRGIARQIAHDYSEGKLDRLGRYKNGTPSLYTGPEAVDAVFNSMGPKEGGINIGSLFMRARSAGWTGNPFSDGRTASETFEGVGANTSEQNDSAGAWPEPVDLFAAKDYKKDAKITRDMLPDAIADFAFDAAERLGVEPAMTTVPCLAVAAASLHDAIKIQPKKHDTDYQVRACTWGAMIGEPGVGKSPGIKVATGILNIIEGQWNEEDAKAFVKHNHAHALYEAAKKANLKTREPTQIVGNKMPDIPDDAVLAEPEKPKKRAIIIDNATMEGLYKPLLDNPRGMLVVKEELKEWIESFDAYSIRAGKDRAAALRLRDGGRLKVSRAADDRNFDIPNWSASVIGGIQGDVLKSMVKKLDMSSDGFLQRFQPFFGEKIETETGQDRPPNYAAKNRYENLIRRLVALEPTTPRRAVVLSAEARPYWDRLVTLANHVSRADENISALRNHASKWGGMFAEVPARVVLEFGVARSPVT